MTDAERKEKSMQPSNIRTVEPRPIKTPTRRSAVGLFGAAMALFNSASGASAQSRFEKPNGAMTLGQYATDKKTVSEAVGGGGVLVLMDSPGLHGFVQVKPQPNDHSNVTNPFWCSPMISTTRSTEHTFEVPICISQRIGT
jgi:hypothetical protein